ncbi:hypothetical protein ACSBOB_00835 [Mesorhizobium sp. ASY16-5R]|uniref:hypothetical protein n=1 Tax=Mesorhizobium sp. ASY16-5R TaxID=3445772 RepID=UPI003FA06622
MLTRRKLLASTPALAVAVATPAVAACSTPDADAELIRLGVEFDRTAREYLAIQPKRHAAYEIWSSELVRLGIGFGGKDRRYNRLMRSTGYGPLADRSNKLTNALIVLFGQIVALPATTIPGVAVKATAVAWDAGDYGFPDEDNSNGDPDYLGFWAIVHELRALAGLPSIAELAVQSC